MANHKDCPWCGVIGEVDRCHSGNHYLIICDNSECPVNPRTEDNFDTEDEAWASWDLRQEPGEPVDGVLGCPSCGGTAKSKAFDGDLEGDGYVGCWRTEEAEDDCPMDPGIDWQSAGGPTEAEAITQWNTRASTPTNKI